METKKIEIIIVKNMEDSIDLMLDENFELRLYAELFQTNLRKLKLEKALSAADKEVNSNGFHGSTTFAWNSDEKQKRLLRKQFGLLTEYVRTLKERISLLSNDIRKFDMFLSDYKEGSVMLVIERNHL